MPEAVDPAEENVPRLAMPLKRITIMVEDYEATEYQIYTVENVDLFTLTRYANRQPGIENYLFEIRLHGKDDIYVRKCGGDPA